MSKVVVFGSLNMDLSIESDHMPVMGETIMGRCFITNPGGKGANQAVASAKLGAEVVMLGAVGEDAFGDQMIAALAEEGVQCERIERVHDLATGVALITRVQGDNFIVLGSGANAAPTAEGVHASLDEVARGGDVFLTQLECDFDATMEALRDAHDRGMYTVLNPAPARQLPEWVYPCLDMVVVNESECEILTGVYPEDEASAQAAMEKLSLLGVGTVVVTLGERGHRHHVRRRYLYRRFGCKLCSRRDVGKCRRPCNQGFGHGHHENRRTAVHPLFGGREIAR